MNFLYECRFGSFFYVHVSREKMPKQCSCKKFVRKMLMKLTPDCGWIDSSLICEEEQISLQQNVGLFCLQKEIFWVMFRIVKLNKSSEDLVKIYCYKRVIQDRCDGINPECWIITDSNLLSYSTLSNFEMPKLVNGILNVILAQNMNNNKSYWRLGENRSEVTWG